MPAAATERRRLPSPVWLAPIVALAIGGWLAYETLSNREPLITVTFADGTGLTAGRTAVRYRAVDVGLVEGVGLTPDLNGVAAAIRMKPELADRLTDDARFWIVRPRLGAAQLSGLETIVSGSYVALDPGGSDGGTKGRFTGLAEPPGVRSDEAGTAFVVTAPRLGPLGPGAPVFFRDVVVGEVMNHDQPDLDGDVALSVFVRAPFDRSVREGSQFWNTSGVRLELDGGGVQITVDSLAALLSGGIAFRTPPEAADRPPAAADTRFPLYASLAAAEDAALDERVGMVSYFRDSASGIAPGAPVRQFGLRVGTVDAVALQLDSQKGNASVRIAYRIQPERIFPRDMLPTEDPFVVTSRLVASGMRAELTTDNLLTGQKALSLSLLPDARAAALGREGDRLVVPSVGGGGIGDIGRAASGVLRRIEALPLERLVGDLGALLGSIGDRVDDPALKSAIEDLAGLAETARGLAARFERDAAPALDRLPALVAALEAAAEGGSAAVRSLRTGYLGDDAQFRRNLDDLLDETSEAARAIRLLADYLERHPEALLRGRSR